MPGAGGEAGVAGRGGAGGGRGVEEVVTELGRGGGGQVGWDSLSKKPAVPLRKYEFGIFSGDNLFA